MDRDTFVIVLKAMYMFVVDAVVVIVLIVVARRHWVTPEERLSALAPLGEGKPQADVNGLDGSTPG